ncbi:MAG: type II toxin-antitoxin system RatA family toxin [Alphaproteobacteria bacterium]
MYNYSDIKQMDFSAEQMYQLVKDIEKYPEFLPWCDGLRIKSQNDTEVVADMVVGFKSISEKFTSRVNFDEADKKIIVRYEDGPFKSLENNWRFEENDNGCLVHFDISFEFKSKLLDMVMSPVFEKIVGKMVSAFEQRAKDLYSG